MTKEVLYQYLGTNGTILSPVHLEDIYYVRKVRLIAGKGRLLTNGTAKVKSITVADDEVSNWTEIVDKLAK